MRLRLVALFPTLVPTIAAAQAQGPGAAPTAAPALAVAPYCPGEYADDASALTPQARDLEAQLPAYTFCIRTTAVYECPSYGADGNLRRKRKQVVAHGTGFAYRQQDGDTLLLTNQHVAEWPAVTDDDHPVDDVPHGCKRVADSLKIVDNESDSYDRDDVALTRVVTDPQLDLAVVKTKTQLPVLPWKIGHSASLRERNIVAVRGFPLGFFKATNMGKVVSAHDRDGYKDWDHDDFVIDALLSPGNSGSPVFAISCRTHEFELVGVYHAAYTRGSALNVVVGIDQARDLMTTLKRGTRPRPEAGNVLDSEARARLVEAAQRAPEPFFPFGGLGAALRTRSDGALIYELFNRDFPVRTNPALVLEDLPGPSAADFGAAGRIWLGNRRGLKGYTRSDLDADTQALIARLLEAMRRDAVTAFALRTADQDAELSRERYERTVRLEKALRRSSAGHADLAQAALELADKLGPQEGEAIVALPTVLNPPQASAAAPRTPPSPVPPSPVD
jgi:S1-C subfamily serine protease